jgi:hypothetical protein
MEMITSKLRLLIGIGIGIAIFCFRTSDAIQVGNPNVAWSSHSYEQTRPQQAQAIKEDIPIIIHNPPSEISSNKDFVLEAIVKNIGIGTPIIHYRFGNSKDYYTRLLHQEEPGVFGLKIISAALIDRKIDYYFEVTTGAKTLASLGSESEPISIKIVTPGPPIWLIALGLFAVAGILLIRPSFSRPNAKTENKNGNNLPRKSAFNSTAEKFAKIK